VLSHYYSNRTHADRPSNCDAIFLTWLYSVKLPANKFHVENNHTHFYIGVTKEYMIYTKKTFPWWKEKLALFDHKPKPSYLAIGLPIPTK